MFRYALFTLAVFTWVACLGCNQRSARPSVTIEGTVTVDETPLPQGSIHFTSPLTGESAYVNLQPDGTYAVSFPEADLGEAYEVSIQKPQIELEDAHAKAERIKMDVKIPPKYAHRTTSGLTFTVQEGGTQTFDVELSSK
ncbi:hypothetical protein [Bremerella alba]|uniref:Carboxypeptidase regulatory-like domain-containing protein n=1 Tax=Bremerella alba TaxID=980252 RepID=A0A7V9A5N2_9BACT|nr:hypothetical protein [Bremerella alba]MBA2113467.1 hypothetical protein [Bremerella alba]